MTDMPARDRIIYSAAELFELQGYHATGLNQIVKESQSPKGSLYHYFPDGKEGIAIAAIKRMTAHIDERIQSVISQYDDPADGVQALIHQIAVRFEDSGCSKGSPIAVVALETSHTNENLRKACEASYRARRERFEEKLQASGYSEMQSQALANLIVSAIDGAIISSRTARDPQALYDIAELLHMTIRVARQDSKSL